MLRHRLDEARTGGIVAELPAERLDALGERFVGDRHSAPHLVEEAVLGNQLTGFPHEQCEGVEIAGIELHRRIVAPQLAVARVEHEPVEAKAAGDHFSAKPHDLLMPFIAASVIAMRRSSMETGQWQKRMSAVGGADSPGA